MPEVICNTSPLQYLHQLGLLHLLPALAGKIVIPPAVAEELAAGKSAGIDVPEVGGLEWITMRRPVSAPALPLVTDLGPGESQVLALALEMPGAVVIVDDFLARRTAEALLSPLPVPWEYCWLPSGPVDRRDRPHSGQPPGLAIPGQCRYSHHGFEAGRGKLTKTD